MILATVTLFTSMFSWWYGAGWRQQVKKAQLRLAGLADFFSIGLLIETFGSPFRQISAGGRVKGSLEVKIRVFLDRLISRLIGMAIRAFMIIFGSITLGLYALLLGLGIIIWGIIPFSPLIGAVLSVLLYSLGPLL